MLFFRITLSSIEIFRAETWTEEEKQSTDFMNWKSQTKVVAEGLNSGYLCHSVETQIIYNLMKVILLIKRWFLILWTWMVVCFFVLALCWTSSLYPGSGPNSSYQTGYDDVVIIVRKEEFFYQLLLRAMTAIKQYFLITVFSSFSFLRMGLLIYTLVVFIT